MLCRPTFGLASNVDYDWDAVVSQMLKAADVERSWRRWLLRHRCIDTADRLTADTHSSAIRRPSGIPCRPYSGRSTRPAPRTRHEEYQQVIDEAREAAGQPPAVLTNSQPLQRTKPADDLTAQRWPIIVSRTNPRHHRRRQSRQRRPVEPMAQRSGVTDRHGCSGPRHPTPKQQEGWWMSVLDTGMTTLAQ